MIIIGDIGNTEVKICLVDNSFKIKKKVSIKTMEASNAKIKKNISSLLKNKKKINIIVFSSVVPKLLKKFTFFFNKNLNKKIIEIKKLKLNQLIDIRVNKKQVGSDRLANSIGAIDRVNN